MLLELQIFSESEIYCLINCYDENVNEDKKMLGETHNINFIKEFSNFKNKFKFKNNFDKKRSFKKELSNLVKKYENNSNNQARQNSTRFPNKVMKNS